MWYNKNVGRNKTTYKQLKIWRYWNMKELERLRESIRTLLKDIQFNNESGLDNTFNYELYEELTSELEAYMNEC